MRNSCYLESTTNKIAHLRSMYKTQMVRVDRACDVVLQVYKEDFCPEDSRLTSLRNKSSKLRLKWFRMRGAFSNRMSAMASAVQANDHNHEQTIHSGHFMVSRVHEENDDQPGEEKDFAENDNNVVQQSNVTRSGCHSFDASIDLSLAGLFRQMTLAYRLN